MKGLVADDAQKRALGGGEVMRIKHVHIDLFVADAAKRDGYP